MRVNRTSRKRALTAAALIILPIAGGGFMLQRRDPGDAARLFLQVFSRVANDGVEELSADQVYEKAARGLVRNLNDPYADLYSPAELATFTRNSLGNAYGGLGVVVEDQQGTFIISTVFPGTPAAAGGVLVGDRVVSIDGTPASGLKLDGVSGRLTGEIGTTVAVTFARPGVAQPIVSKFVRARVHAPAVPYAMMLEPGIGYVPLQRFNDTAGDEVEEAFAELKKAGARSFVLDLRGNGGGSFDQSLEIANLFLPRDAEIVSVRTRGAPPVISRAVRDATVGNAPLVILTDAFTASASEIVAGALQDHDRAVIVGTTSYGKGLVQSVFPLQGGWALKLTTGRWYTPSGRSIQRERKLREDGRLVEVVPDSLETDQVRKLRPSFKSDGGRLVYGGGGITPDVIVPADTITTIEQQFVRSLAPKSQQSYIALYNLALDVKGSVTRPDFAVDQSWRERYFESLQRLGLVVERGRFDAARPLVDRMIETQIASIAFGDSAAFRRALPHDSQLGRAVTLLHEGRTQRELLALVASKQPEGE
jgi:carboxyl-terminal processing protease